MKQCPECLSWNTDYKSSEILYEENGSDILSVSYLCWECGTVFRTNEDWLTGTDDDTKPSHDDAD